MSRMTFEALPYHELHRLNTKLFDDCANLIGSLAVSSHSKWPHCYCRISEDQMPIHSMHLQPAFAVQNCIYS